MDMLELLHKRQSTPARLLAEPAPSDDDIAAMVRAGLAAPDHARMRPWRFMVIRGDARNKLGEIFYQATAKREPDMPGEKLDKQRDKPLRSPLILVTIAKITPDHPKTPEIEQILSAGAAMQLMQLAASSLGYGSIWLTGPNAQDSFVKEALGISAGDEIVGFLYLGTATQTREAVARADLNDHLEYWSG